MIILPIILAVMTGIAVVNQNTEYEKYIQKREQCFKSTKDKKCFEELK